MSIPALKFVRTLGLRVLNDDLSLVPFCGQTVVHTISPNSYGISTRDSEFLSALKAADILTLDGEYFGLAAIFLQHTAIRRQNGPANFRCFMKKANEENARVFFLGASENTLEKIKKRCAKDYPNVTVGTYSPPYKARFSPEENRMMIAGINEFKPQLLCVGMTAPKQEKWVFEHAESLDANVIITIGQVFDWYAGTMEEPAPIWTRLHLLWLIRTIKRPEILKRYPNIAIFFWVLLLNILHFRRD